ncbi:hypothetical protein B0H66DRAFT_559328 [Apodospora peruviana]|uniref:Secreted protein n=1 Tax=Apodospora peruviana TaxID=516989 RepID=A0AAE0I6Q5_9PEZI|nr:hypothetical protein B0H66DRAFT_559328 [Apodospora peruviana]
MMRFSSVFIFFPLVLLFMRKRGSRVHQHCPAVRGPSGSSSRTTTTGFLNIFNGLPNNRRRRHRVPQRRRTLVLGRCVDLCSMDSLPS